METKISRWNSKTTHSRRDGSLGQLCGSGLKVGVGLLKGGLHVFGVDHQPLDVVDLAVLVSVGLSEALV